MQTVTSTNFIQNFGKLTYEVQREPIAITNHGKVTGYFMAAHEYEELQKLKKALSDREAYSMETLPETEYQKIMEAEVDPKYDHLNVLLEDNPAAPKA